MKSIKSIIINAITVLFLCTIYALSIFESTPVYAIESNDRYVQQEKTGVEIVLKRDISPGKLPGGNEPPEKINKDHTDYTQIRYLSTKIASLPKLGSSKNSWSFIGMIFLVTVFLYINFNKKKKEVL